MKAKFLIDTNVFLRFLLKDNQQQYDQAVDYFTQARESKIEIVVLPQVLFELIYVLNGFYNMSKQEVYDVISKIVKSDYLDVFDRDIWLKVLPTWLEKNIDAVDIYLYYYAQTYNCHVLSYDRDYKKLELLPSSNS